MIGPYERCARSFIPALASTLFLASTVPLGCDGGSGDGGHDLSPWVQNDVGQAGGDTAQPDVGESDQPGPVETQEPDLGDFVVEYELPQSPKLQDLASGIRDSGYPDALAEFLNTQLALPRDLPLVFAQCDKVNAYYAGEDKRITICWEMLVDIAQAFADHDWTDESGSVGTLALYAWTWVIFHEVGHALVDYYQLPITGKEEDAVDDFSTLLLILDDSAEAAVHAAVYFRFQDNGEHPPSALANEHGLHLQRFYNIMCIVYGSAPAEYGYFETQFPEMEGRLPRCEGEYVQKLKSWATLLAPWAK